MASNQGKSIFGNNIVIRGSGKTNIKVNGVYYDSNGNPQSAPVQSPSPIPLVTQSAISNAPPSPVKPGPGNNIVIRGGGANIVLGGDVSGGKFFNTRVNGVYYDHKGNPQ